MTTIKDLQKALDTQFLPDQEERKHIKELMHQELDRLSARGEQLTEANLYWLCIRMHTLGKLYGVREERTKNKAKR